MFAIKYLEPAVAVIIGNASGPILVVIISKILRPNFRIFRIEKIASIGIFLSLLFIIYSTLIGKSAVNSINADNVFWGVVLCIFTGLGQVLFSIYSKKLNEEHFEPSEILALRFPLAIVVSSIFINSDMLHQLTSSLSLVASVIILCLFGMVLPIYFYQKSIKLIEPFYISILYMIEPILMFLAQVFDPRLSISFHSYIGVGLICAFSVLSILGRYHGNKMLLKIRNKTSYKFIK
jgi:drug/metabolite transporter (DMT)-like permease